MHVDTALQRVGTTAVAAHACLTAGLPQWLGIALAPKHDRLEAASIRVTLLGRPGGGPSPAPGKGPISLEAEPDSPGWILPLGPGEALRRCPVPVIPASGCQLSASYEVRWPLSQAISSSAILMLQYMPCSACWVDAQY